MMLREHTCPVCNGSGRRPAGDYKYKHITSGYDATTDTLRCNNCGGQYMYGMPSGKVRANKEGMPCTHHYTSSTIGRCLTEYTCKHCGDRYTIDSGD